jgi:CxxC motif-containing protein (DUF1111 family)
MHHLPTLVTVVVAATAIASAAFAQFIARDPGPRGGVAGAGGKIAGLTASQVEYFNAGQAAFAESDTVGSGLGPRFNLDSCGGCHAQPAIGGTSPAINPQVSVATAFGARNVPPSFVRADGPVREARFKYKADGARDGGVHALYVISGRVDNTGSATGCTIVQEDFETQVVKKNVSRRIPTPLFGGGLIEQIPDSAILTNQALNAAAKTALGIAGRPNRNGNDGTIGRFGWKAQNKSLLIFSGEAYNVEQGITNELFPTERDETWSCQFHSYPNDTTATDAAGVDVLSDIEKFTFFARFLAPPLNSETTPGGSDSVGRGRYFFKTIGCAHCHAPQLHSGYSTVLALREQPVKLFSDLLLHRMGPGLADDIVQGDAAGDEFRTAPLWGLGQRLFFLHDGRTKDLVDAILAHQSPASSQYRASEANAVIDAYRALQESQKQDVLNFLRSL